MQHQDESQNIMLGKRNQTQKATNYMIICHPEKDKIIETEIRSVSAMGWGWGEGNDCKTDGRIFGVIKMFYIFKKIFLN